jgi:hypothetical protein
VNDCPPRCQLTVTSFGVSVASTGNCETGNWNVVVSPVFSERRLTCVATGAPLTVSVTLRISIVSGAGADPQIFMIVTEKPCG